MININRNNYEEYFLDFLDGQLSPSEENIVWIFLTENPDLKAELELIKNEISITNQAVYNQKDELKKSIFLNRLTSTNFDELCIARLEGDLTEKEKIHFDDFILQNPSRKKDYQLYELTKITSDTEVQFNSKRILKKQEKKTLVRFSNFTLISIAASVLFLIALFLFAPQENELNHHLIVKEDVNDEKVQKPIVVKEVQHNKLAKSENSININITAKKQQSSKKKVEIKESLMRETNVEVVEYIQEANLIPVNIQVSVVNGLDIIYVKPFNEEMKIEKQNEAEQYVSVKTFLASAFNKRILRNENKDKIEFFDIAQAGVKGINRLIGSKMSLERKYNKNGIADKTEFNSRLFAFSTPIKKDE